MKGVNIMLAAALAFGMSVGLVHSAEMKGMDMKGDASPTGSKDKSPVTHKATGIVRKVDAKAGTVTLAHGPVTSLNWAAMTMTFQVKDKAVLDKVAEGRKMEVEFEQRGKDYVITSVK